MAPAEGIGVSYPMGRTRRKAPAKRLPSADIYTGRPPRLRRLLTITASGRRRSVLETHSSLASDLGRDRHLGFDAVSAVRGSRLEPAFEGVTVPRRAIPPCRLEPSGDAVIDARVGLYVSLVPLLTLSLAQVDQLV